MAITTLAALPASGTFDAAVQSYDAAQYAAINAFVAAQNANNAQFATTPVPSAQLDPQTIQYVTVSLSLAQILAMYGTPLSVIAAAGAGTLIEVVSAVLDLVYGSAGYSGGGVVQLSYGASVTTPASGTIAASVFTGLSANTTVLMSNTSTFQTTGSSAIASSACLNTAIYLAMATANFTVGTGGSGKLKIAYRVHTGLA